MTQVMLGIPAKEVYAYLAIIKEAGSKDSVNSFITPEVKKIINRTHETIKSCVKLIETIDAPLNKLRNYVTSSKQTKTGSITKEFNIFPYDVIKDYAQNVINNSIELIKALSFFNNNLLKKGNFSEKSIAQKNLDLINKMKNSLSENELIIPTRIKTLILFSLREPVNEFDFEKIKILFNKYTENKEHLKNLKNSVDYYTKSLEKTFNEDFINKFSKIKKDLDAIMYDCINLINDYDKLDLNSENTESVFLNITLLDKVKKIISGFSSLIFSITLDELDYYRGIYNYLLIIDLYINQVYSLIAILFNKKVKTYGFMQETIEKEKDWINFLKMGVETEEYKKERKRLEEISKTNLIYYFKQDKRINEIRKVLDDKLKSYYNKIEDKKFNEKMKRINDKLKRSEKLLKQRHDIFKSFKINELEYKNKNLEVLTKSLKEPDRLERYKSGGILNLLLLSKKRESLADDLKNAKTYEQWVNNYPESKNFLNFNINNVIEIKSVKKEIDKLLKKV